MVARLDQLGLTPSENSKWSVGLDNTEISQSLISQISGRKKSKKGPVEPVTNVPTTCGIHIPSRYIQRTIWTPEIRYYKSKWGHVPIIPIDKKDIFPGGVIGHTGKAQKRFFGEDLDSLKFSIFVQNFNLNHYIDNDRKI